MNDFTWDKENLWRLLTSEDDANVTLARQMLKGVPFGLAKEMMIKSELYWRVKRIFYDSLVILERCEKQGTDEFVTEDYLGTESEALKNYWIRFEDIINYHQQKLNDRQIRQLLRWRILHNVRAYTKEDEIYVALNNDI
ncbi:hypothetical protein [Microscilla marina]|uniref:Uncharacterized protein n=1 Tax=Microscilla marina ATCC 23134 TaxID=313606 RepID=A1ZHW5_MICM2|nr:hypothetical protein [Microscilla marina]EAY30122.1 hypothetical protein M23134_05455 [Microscilla marina ATCC 23134]